MTHCRVEVLLLRKAELITAEAGGLRTVIGIVSDAVNAATAIPTEMVNMINNAAIIRLLL